MARTAKNAGKEWTKAENKTLAADYKKGMSVKAIAKQLGRTPYAVTSHAHALHLQHC